MNGTPANPIDFGGTASASRVLRAVVITCLLVAATLVAAAVAYHFLFSFFPPYDDEGYFLVTLRQFLGGHPLYDQVYTQYGPFYYWLNWLGFAPVGVLPNHDSIGCLVVGVWATCLLLNALFVQRLTGSVLLAVLALLFTFRTLFGFAFEPGHPQGLCVLMITLLPLLATAQGVRSRAACNAVTGALLAGLLLTKVNVGVFATTGVALSLGWATRGRTGAALAMAAGIGVLALPAVLMRPHWGTDWAVTYALLVTLSALPIVLAHWQRESSFLRPRDWLPFLGGAAIISLAVIGATLAHGTSPAGLLDGVLLQHTRFATAFYLHADIPRASIAAALASVGLYGLYRAARTRPPAQDALAGLLLVAKGLFAAFVLYNSYQIGQRVMLSYALPFAWLALTSAGPAQPGGRFTYARHVLAAQAVLQSLVAYPVAGSQGSLATVFLNVLAILCLSDVAAGVLGTAATGRRFVWQTLAALALIGLQGKYALDTRRYYDSLDPLELPGAARIRLPEGQATVYRWLAANLDAFADTFVTMPGLNSLYLWTGREPPTTYNTTDWMALFDAGRQEQIVAAAAAHPRICAVRSLSLARSWLRGQDLATMPLAGYIDREFRTIGSVGGYEFRVGVGRTDVEPVLCVRPAETGANGWTHRALLTALPGRTAFRFTITELLPDSADRPTTAPSERTLADSEAGAAVHLRIGVGGAGHVAAAPASLDLSSRCQLWLKLPPAALSARGRALVLRLFDADNRRILSVPFLD